MCLDWLCTWHHRLKGNHGFNTTITKSENGDIKDKSSAQTHLVRREADIVFHCSVITKVHHSESSLCTKTDMHHVGEAQNWCCVPKQSHNGKCFQQSRRNSTINSNKSQTSLKILKAAHTTVKTPSSRCWWFLPIAHELVYNLFYQQSSPGLWKRVPATGPTPVTRS